ncbi:class I SAM-dependent RNA methyltransferase [uncultured Amaricoccus sp.]|uniref:THUMP domain-containing class I SAM-dependent RNA methyltransferase n=1 Tax=uncultured Amaricoccus sp. TaxID=339341 RepID=UPI002634BCAF|nr:class I SAM-dependent RNA methyltransferase [uncultured Amaricoccus sp.]
MDPFEIFLAGPPGLEPVLADEARAAGFPSPKGVPGGVTFRGGWPDVWRANLSLRGPSRVLARIGGFRVLHLAQLDKRARKFAWAEFLRPDVPVRVEVTSHASRVYHEGAARQRIATAIRETLGAPVVDGTVEDAVTLRARIERDMCEFSLDTSGELLHRRGHKQAVNAAPMRETLAALLLRACGYAGVEPVLDPMCGSGTFVIEAAEIAAGLAPGRSRGFAFERLATFDAAAWADLRAGAVRVATPLRFRGADRDAGAIAMSRANAARAGVSDLTDFTEAPISALRRPDGPPGLVMVNPPYGTRLGDPKALIPLYATLGETLRAGFTGWRVGLVTTEAALAQATALPFLPTGAPIPHGGLRIRLFRTEALG